MCNFVKKCKQKNPKKQTTTVQKQQQQTNMDQEARESLKIKLMFKLCDKSAEKKIIF